MDAFLGELGKNGLLGVLLGIALLAIWFLYNTVEKLHDEKDELHKERTEIIKEQTQANIQLSASLQMLTDKISKGRK